MPQTAQHIIILRSEGVQLFLQPDSRTAAEMLTMSTLFFSCYDCYGNEGNSLAHEVSANSLWTESICPIPLTVKTDLKIIFKSIPIECHNFHQSNHLNITFYSFPHIFPIYFMFVH